MKTTATSWLVAIGCANTLINQGIRIPQDVSIAGFGNVLTAEYYRVPLTTVRQPKFRLGTAAMEAMMQLLRGQRPDTKRLPAELLVRESTASPPAKNNRRKSWPSGSPSCSSKRAGPGDSAARSTGLKPRAAI